VGVLAGALGAAVPARADVLAPRSSLNSPAAHAAEFRPAGEAPPTGATTQASSADALAPLALVLAIPAGMSATSDPGSGSSSNSSNSVVKSPNGSQGGNGGSGSGGGGGNGGVNDPGGNSSNGPTTASVSPEPATLVSALIGSGLAGLAVLRRRRHRD
jgi:hypothetical protein